MKITPTKIPDVKLIEPRVFKDERGFFLESWNRKVFAELGIDRDFVQDNHSRSEKHILRGLHYQLERPQGKLVRVTLGEVFDVAVDLRSDSPTFGQWVGEILSADNHRMLWVPEGFAHGFYTVSPVAEFQYKCTDFYFPEHEKSILWSDPSIGIDWPLGGNPIVSGKDAQGLLWADSEKYK